MTAVVLAVLLQDGAERWIAQLDDERIEVRDAAERALVAMGDSARSCLLAARSRATGESRLRLDAVLAELEELPWDESARRKVLYLDAPPLNLPGPTARTEGMTFLFERCRFAGWTMIDIRDYAVIEGHIDWAVAAVEDENARAQPFAARRGVLAVRGDGPLRVRLRGTRTWLSPTDVVFEDLHKENRKRVGRFRVEVDWPSVTIVSPREYPESLLSRTCEWVEAKGERDTCWVRYDARPDDAFVSRLPTCVPRRERPDARRHTLRFGGECAMPVRLRLTLHRPVDEPFEVESPLLPD